MGSFEVMIIMKIVDLFIRKDKALFLTKINDNNIKINHCRMINFDVLLSFFIKNKALSFRTNKSTLCGRICTMCKTSINTILHY